MAQGAVRTRSLHAGRQLLGCRCHFGATGAEAEAAVLEIWWMCCMRGKLFVSLGQLSPAPAVGARPPGRGHRACRGETAHGQSAASPQTHFARKPAEPQDSRATAGVKRWSCGPRWTHLLPAVRLHLLHSVAPRPHPTACPPVRQVPCQDGGVVAVGHPREAVVAHSNGRQVVEVQRLGCVQVHQSGVKQLA